MKSQQWFLHWSGQSALKSRRCLSELVACSAARASISTSLMICGRSSKALKELFRSYLTCHLYLGCLSQAGVAKQLLKFFLKIHFHEAWKKIADSGRLCGQALQSVRAVPWTSAAGKFAFQCFWVHPEGCCATSPQPSSTVSGGGPVNGLREVHHSSVCLWVGGNFGCKDTESH